MIFKRKHNVIYAAFPGFDARPEITHGIFLLKRDMDGAACNRLNVGGNGGEPQDVVKANRELISRCMNAAPMLFLKQVHGKSIFAADSPANVSSALETPPEADAAVTLQGELNLVIQLADCQPVMLYDPVRQIAANIHSGWRGSVANIIGNCVDVMRDRLGTNPADLIAGIGPSLGPCCAEFVNYRNEIPESFWCYKDGKHRFNFWQISRDQLTTAGVPASHIECSFICTKCNPHLFFSYRRAGEAGRFAAVIALKDNRSQESEGGRS